MARKLRIRWGRLGLVLGLVGLLVAVVVVRLLFSSRLDRDLLKEALARGTGTSVEFRDYSVQWSGQVSLDDLRLHLNEEELLTSRRVEAELSWWSVLKGTPRLETIMLKQPKLTLTPTLLANLKAGQDGEGGSSELTLTFEDAGLSYQGGRGQLELEHLDGSLGPGLLRLKETAKGWSLELKWGNDGALQVLGRQLPLALLGEYLGRPLPYGAADLELTRSGRSLKGAVTLDSTLAAGTVRLDLDQENGLSGELTTESFQVAGLKLGASRFPFSVEGEEVTIQQARLTTPQGELSIDGTVSRKKAELTLRQGSLSVRLQGLLPFQLQGSWEETELLRGSLQAQPWTLAIENFDGGRTLRLAGIDGRGFDFSGQAVWQDGLTVGVASEGGVLHDQKVEKIRLDLEVDSQGRLRGSGSCLVERHPVSLGVRTGEDGHVVLSASAEGLPVDLFRPGLGGTLDVEARTLEGRRVQARVNYSGGADYPAAQGVLEWEGDQIRFSSIKLPELEPPLELSGTYSLADSSLNASATLAGQALKEIWKATPVQARVFGELKLEGPLDELKPRFDGELREVVWDEVKVATVQLALAEGRVKASLPDFALQSVPALEPHLSGVAQITLEGPPDGLVVGVDVPALTARGVELGALKARLKLLEGEDLRVESLELPFLSLKGQVSPESLQLEGRLTSLALERLPLPWDVKGVASGDLNLSGPPESPRVAFTGAVDNLVYQKMPLGRLPVEAVRDPSRTRVKVEGVKVEQVPAVERALPGLQGTLDVSLVHGEEPVVEAALKQGHYQGRKLPALSVKLLQGEKAIAVRRLRLEGEQPLTASGWFNLETRRFELSSSLDSYNVVPLLALLEEAPPVSGQLSGTLWLGGTPEDPSLEFKGSAGQASLAGVTLGSLPQLHLKGGAGGAFLVAAQKIEASAVPPLRAAYPNVTGLVDVRAESSPGEQGVTLQAHLKGGSLPDLSLAGLWKQQVLTVRRLSAATGPPLELTGTLGPDRIDLSGQLQGQSLDQLLRLGGAAPNPDVSAQLFGSLAMEGPPSRPSLRLNGPVQGLTYRRSQLGSGRLELAVGERLQGRLDLDTPYDATLADAAPGSLGRVPLVQSVLKNAVKARISAVTFSGTPADPQVTPVVVGVGVGQGQVKSPAGSPIKLPDPSQGIKIKLPGAPDLKIKL